MKRVRQGFSAISLAALAMTSLEAGAIDATDLPVLRPPAADYGSICNAEKAPATSSADLAAWSPKSTAVSTTEAHAYAREVLSEPESGDTELALALLRKLASSASRERAAALYDLASYDLTHEPAESAVIVERLRESLALGYGRAALMLGQIHERGLAGQPKDPDKARLFYKLTVQSKIEDGALKLAQLARSAGQQDEAVRWLVLAQQMMAFRLADADCSQLLQMAKLYTDGALLPRAPSIAAEWLEAARKAGSAKASRLLGQMLLTGDGLPRDRVRALAMLEEAAAAGDLSARLVLGRFYRGDFGGAPDWPQAIATFKDATDAAPNYPGALLEFGRTLRDSPAELRDLEAAANMLRRAIDAGSVLALRELGGMLLLGDADAAAEGLRLLTAGANRDDPAAAVILGRWLLDHSREAGDRAAAWKWLRMAAASGNVGAAKTLARSLTAQGEFAAAGPYWRQAADHGDAEAFVELAALQQEGRFDAGRGADELLGDAMAASEANPFGFVVLARALRDGRFGEPDRGAAYALFRRAAEKGEPIGLREAGVALATGDGVGRAPAEGRLLLEAAADRGDFMAPVLLARGLVAGWFGEPAPNDAQSLLERAASEGSTPAALELAGFHSRGAFGPIGEGEAVEWWRVAAAAGEVEAMRSLANAYALGFGVPADLRHAADWLERAAALGDRESMYRLAYIYDAGVGVDADPTKADHWMRSATSTTASLNRLP